MKIVAFQGGLGNQLFQYTYYMWLRKKYPAENFFGFYPERGLTSHNGLEIQRWFDVALPPTSFVSDLTGASLFWINKLFWKWQKPHPLTDTDWFRRSDALFYSGYWQDKKYYLETGIPRFKRDLDLGKENITLLRKIDRFESVAVHIRRGDYLSPKARRIYGDICTMNYYHKAIEEMKKRIERPTFFFFSDDVSYIEANFRNIPKTIVSCNKNERSFFDLYLMAHCKNMILANSTFSIWAAYLNENLHTVVCPSKLRNDRPSPPITLESWIKI